MNADTVRRIIETGKTYVIVYRDADDNLTERIVSVEYTAGPLFAAHCHLRNARRCFCYERVLFAAEWDGMPLETFGEAARREQAAEWLPILSNPAIVCWAVA